MNMFSNQYRLSALTKYSVFIYLAIALSILIIYLPMLTHVPLINEETRRALVAKELLETKQYFSATIAGEAYTAKPLLFNWLIIAASQFESGEVTLWSARIPPLVAAIILILFFIHYTQTWWSRKSAIFFAIIFVLSPQIIRKATTAELDMVFTLFVNLSLFSWFYYYQKKKISKAWIISCVFIALAYLCKREAALLFYILSIVGFLIWQQKLILVNNIGALVGLILVIVGISIWIVPIIHTYGTEVFLQQTAKEISARSHKSDIVSYIGSSLLYPIEVIAALLPSAILLPLLFVKNIRKRLHEVYAEKFIFCLFIAFINLIPFVLLGKSSVRYYLPMFPVNFILITMVFSQFNQLPISATLRNWLSFKLPLLMTVLAIVILITICVTQPLTLYAYWAFPFIVFTLLGFIVWSNRLKTEKFSSTNILYFCLALGIVVRIFDLGYTIPRAAVQTEKTRNIPDMLQQIKLVKETEKKMIVASPTFSHAVYFYDDEKIITPLNCKGIVTSDHLVLAISKKKQLLTDKYSAINANIVWQENYRKNKTIYLYSPIKVNAKPQYCQ